jgi:NAD+ synthetase
LALFNAAALCFDGKVQHRYVKHLLPTYDVFDERRYFEPGYRANEQVNDVALYKGVKIGVTICEDLWTDPTVIDRQLYHNDPVSDLVKAGAQLIINCSASPFVMGKHSTRIKLLQNTAKKHNVPVFYCNQVGGNDELVFDGNSCAVDAKGNLIAHAAAFEADLCVVDSEASTPVPYQEMQTLQSAYHALVLGLRDYCSKCGFKSIVLGLSGGIDSALTCAIAVDALGKDNVRGVTMPSRYSSDGSVSDAEDLANRLGIKFHTVPIAQPHQTLEAMLQPHFEGKAIDVTEENVQARIRGVILMAFSNKFGSLLVTTGNKSELAVGYCTLYGDMCGGMAVLSDVPKTTVWELSRWINASDQSPLKQQYGIAVIPENSITKPPSAELRPDQCDQDSLPPYEILDQIVERYVEREQSADQIIAETGMDRDMVLRFVQLIDRNEYKRKQAAPGLKITGRAFGVGRRMPMAQRYDNRKTLE